MRRHLMTHTLSCVGMRQTVAAGTDVLCLTTMKKSRYNIILREENTSLIYNSFTNTYVALSNAVCDAFSTLSVGEFSKTYGTSYERMCEEGMIIPDKRDELSVIRYRNKVSAFGSRELRVVIYPTQDCNLKCWYCYERHIAGTRMSMDVAGRVEKFFRKSVESGSFDDYTVTFFGGEPLTDFNTIAYPLLVRIKKTVEDASKRFSCSFVTNASLMDDDVITKIADIKPHLQITLDGGRRHHDKIRMWKKGDAPTYDHIIWALHKLAEKTDGERFFLTLRINYDNESLRSVPEILDSIKDIDRKKIFIHFERVWQTENDSTECHRELLKEIMWKFLREGFCVNQGSFNGAPYSCPSDTNGSIIINYDGTLHKCNGRTLSRNTQYGVLGEDGSLDVDDDLLARRLAVATFENEECLKCKMLPVCMGPCSQKLLEHGGKWDRRICSMGSLDTSLRDYLVMDFRVRQMVGRYNA